MILKTFPKGGVHPPESKITAGKAIEKIPLPKTVTIALSQHLGAPAVPVVAKGDRVLAGQLIARQNGFVSANIHSPVSGTVSKIENVTDTTGYKNNAIIIDAEGEDWVPGVTGGKGEEAYKSMTPDEIIAKCLEMGVVGLGGATFPTHIKLKVPAGKSCRVLIINGAECEPYLTSDQLLMTTYPDKIVSGIRAMMKALNAGKAMVGIENNKPDAVESMSKAINGHGDISVHPLKVKYPQGGEKQLIKALTGREVPSGGLPADVGVVVQNAGTAFALYEAIQMNKPLVERVVTVTGKALSKPGNYLVKIGTPVSHLIESAGGMPENTGKIVNGGPMMGKAIALTDIPVTKGTSGIIVIPEHESGRKATGPCIRCAKCIDACAMGLEPYLLMTVSEKSLFDRAEEEKITDCMECGSCSYICPASRPLLDYIRLGKSNVSRIIRERKLK